MRNGISTRILLGDSKEVLKDLNKNSVDLIVTSPPYADSRKNTYGGIHPDKYVEWFLPISEELFRVTKQTGTFILNIKEKVVGGERHTYVIELILALRKQGWLWTEEFIWHKKTRSRVNGQTGFEIRGSACFSSTNRKTLQCTKMPSWFQLVTGQGCA